MEITEVDWKEYNSIFSKPYHVFNSAAFNHINERKCEEVKFLVFKDTKYRVGFVAGVRNNQLISPFSAPFGGFTFLKEDIQIRQIEEAITLLEEYAKSNGLNAIKIFLPPLIYNESFLAKCINVLYRSSFQTKDLDLDFYMNLDLVDDYLNNIWYNAKKNTKISLAQGFEFIQGSNDETFVSEVYEVIKENRAFKGKPLNMSLEDILATSNVIPTDFFLVKQNNINVASAIVYHATDDIMYVPFWGDQPGHTLSKPMNFTAYQVFKHYQELGKKYVHIGISTESSVPNYGLCEFKESIGCTITPKFTFFKEL